MLLIIFSVKLCFSCLVNYLTLFTERNGLFLFFNFLAFSCQPFLFCIFNLYLIYICYIGTVSLSSEFPTFCLYLYLVFTSGEKKSFASNIVLTLSYLTVSRPIFLTGEFRHWCRLDVELPCSFTTIGKMLRTHSQKIRLQPWDVSKYCLWPWNCSDLWT